MKINSPKPTCLLCKKKYTDKGITKHLKSCIPKTLEQQSKLLIKAIDEYKGPIAKNKPIEILARNNSPRTGVCGYTG